MEITTTTKIPSTTEYLRRGRSNLHKSVYRDRTVIMYHMLYVIKESTKGDGLAIKKAGSTRILYMAHLSQVQFRHYMKILIQTDLIERIEEDDEYTEVVKAIYKSKKRK